MPFSFRVMSRSSKVSSASSVRQFSVDMQVRQRPLEECFSIRGGGVEDVDVDAISVVDVVLVVIVVDDVGKVIARPTAVLRGATALQNNSRAKAVQL